MDDREADAEPTRRVAANLMILGLTALGGVGLWGSVADSSEVRPAPSYRVDWAGPSDAELRALPGIGPGDAARIRIALEGGTPPDRLLIELSDLPRSAREALIAQGVPIPPAPAPIAERGPIDPNTATAEALDAIPGIGPVLAARIIEARREKPFTSLEDFDLRVPGIGPVTARRVAPFLRFAPKSSTIPD